MKKEQTSAELSKLKENTDNNNTYKNYENNLIIFKHKLQFNLNPKITADDLEKQLKELEYYIYRSDFNINDSMLAEECLDLIENRSKSESKSTDKLLIIGEEIKNKFFELRDYIKKIRLQNMALIPSGKIFIGSNFHHLNERPVFEEEIAEFYLDIMPVSVKSFLLVCPEYKDEIAKYKFLDEPIRNINWNMANTYARRIGKRLPTEKEWIYAAQGLEKNIYATGKNLDNAIANKNSEWFNYRLSEQAPCNIFGIYHLTGLVWEWCEDWYLPYPGNYISSDDYNYKYKILKGGCWRSNKDECRNNFRYFQPKEYKDETIGFRCAW